MSENLKEKKLRVVVYCRVSHTKEDKKQSTSYEFQKEYYENYVKENPNWELVEIYAERGSGTKINRKEFTRMMADAGLLVSVNNKKYLVEDLEGVKSKFDLIIVKDSKRLSRNIDIMPVISALRKKNVGIFFENLQKSTLNVEDMFAITVLLSVDDNHSKSLSKNIKLSVNRQRELNPLYKPSKYYAMGFSYREDEEFGKFFFPSSEKVIKDFTRMFELYTYEKYGFKRCADYLTNLGYRTPNGGELYPQTVEKIIRNPIYKGCIPVYHHNEQTLNNMGTIRWKYLDNEMVSFVKAKNVQQMITDKLWDEANRELQSRDIINNRGVKRPQTIYSKLLTCGYCGQIFVVNRKEHKKFYMCKSKRKSSNCRNPYLELDFLDDYFDKQVQDGSFIRDFKAKMQAHIDFCTFYRYALIATFFSVKDYELIKQTKAQIEEIEKKQDEFTDRFESLPVEVVNRKVLKFQKEIEELQKKLSSTDIKVEDFKQDLYAINKLISLLKKKNVEEVKTKEELFELIDSVIVNPTYSELKHMRKTRNQVSFNIISKAQSEIEEIIFITMDRMKISLDEKYTIMWESQTLFTEEQKEELDKQARTFN